MADKEKKDKEFEVEELDSDLEDVAGGSCIGCDSCSGCSGSGCGGCGPMDQTPVVGQS